MVFNSKDENLNKAHVRFLEYSIYSAALAAKRCRLENTNIPSCPAIAEAEQAVMVEFLENLKVLVGTMGYKIFEPLRGPSSKCAKVYHISAALGAKAQALITTEGVVVTEGSEAAISCVPSIAPATVALREKLIKEGVKGFSANVRTIFDFFEFETEIEKMREANILYLVVSRFCEVASRGA